MAKTKRRRAQNHEDHDETQDPNQRDPTHLSATDLDHPTLALQSALTDVPPHHVFTPDGPKPLYPTTPEIPESSERTEEMDTPPVPPTEEQQLESAGWQYDPSQPKPDWLTAVEDNPATRDEVWNPKGAPSMHLPQQSTPLLTRSDGELIPSLKLVNDPAHYQDGEEPEIDLQAGIAYVPYAGWNLTTNDNVLNPKGTPDYLIEAAVNVTPDYDGAAGAGVPNTIGEPRTITPDFDNPKNPKGITSNNANGAPDAQAFDAQKAQNPTPARPSTLATTFPELFAERVSAGQNRKPPLELIP